MALAWKIAFSSGMLVAVAVGLAHPEAALQAADVFRALGSWDERGDPLTAVNPLVAAEASLTCAASHCPRVYDVGALLSHLR